jgi:hypothetical protein
MMRFCVPDGPSTDRYIFRIDNILFPIDPGSSRARYASDWLSRPTNQEFLRRLILYRQGIKHEARLDLAVIALKWTCRDRSVECLDPNHMLMDNFNEAIRWSVCEPTSQIRPLAEAASRLRRFFELSLPKLVRRPVEELARRLEENKERKQTNTFAAKSQLFVLDKLLFSSVSLTNRYHETVLPARLVHSEIIQGGQNSGVAALLNRHAENGGYVDTTTYWKIREFKGIGLKLQKFLLLHLNDHRELRKITETIDPRDRVAFVKRLIVLAICCCSSQNFRGRYGLAAENDLFSLQRLPLLCENVEFWALKPALIQLTHAERQIGPFIGRLTNVAEALGDPLQAVIDPVRWKRMGVTGSKLLSAIPKVFVRAVDGQLETSATFQFSGSTVQVGPTEKISAVVDGDEEEDAAAVDEVDTFEGSTRKLEDIEADRAARSNPIVIRYLRRWAQQYSVFQKTTRSLTGADRRVFYKLNGMKLRPTQRFALFSEACRALSHVSESCYEEARVVLLWFKADRAFQKSIVESHNKGSPAKWLKDFRAALKVIETLMDDLRALLVVQGDAGLDALEIIVRSDKLVGAVKAFEQENKRIIDACYKKKGIVREEQR